MRNTKKVLDTALNAAKRDVAPPAASLNLANPLYHPGVPASNVNRPETHLPSLETSNLGSDMRRTIATAHYQMFGDRRSFSISSDASRGGEPKEQRTWKLEDGTEVTLRYARPGDELLVPDFYDNLSDASIRLRWWGSRDYEHYQYLQESCLKDTTVVIYNENEKKIIGMGGLTRSSRPDWAMSDLIISDDYHGKGLGSSIKEELLQRAKAKGYVGLEAWIDVRNKKMLNWWEKRGAKISYQRDKAIAEMYL